jgi:ubiquinone/menaquinone biosynthesis C-methylase UbiE
MNYKEFWNDTYEYLEEELQREPTADEIKNAVEERMESIRGCYEE